MKQAYKKTYKFAIIGTGYIFQKHVEAIRSIGGEITDVMNENAILDYEEFILKTKAEYIVILTPNHLHFDMAIFAAENGKTVLCEKPLAINSDDMATLSKYDNIFTVLQLRHHPLLREMRRRIIEENDINLDIAVYRDRTYKLGWKGNDVLSGGIKFNLGIHYFDLAYYLAGDKKLNLTWNLSVDEVKKKSRRIITINGHEFNLSCKENLSEENLHNIVYADLVTGRGVKAKDLIELTKKIEEL